MSLFTLMNESCHTHGWVMSHTWMGHVRETCISTLDDHSFELDGSCV